VSNVATPCIIHLTHNLESYSLLHGTVLSLPQPAALWFIMPTFTAEWKRHRSLECHMSQWDMSCAWFRIPTVAFYRQLFGWMWRVEMRCQIIKGTFIEQEREGKELGKGTEIAFVTRQNKKTFHTDTCSIWYICLNEAWSFTAQMATKQCGETATVSLILQNE